MEKRLSLVKLNEAVVNNKKNTINVMKQSKKHVQIPLPQSNIQIPFSNGLAMLATFFLSILANIASGWVFTFEIAFFVSFSSILMGLWVI